MHAGAGPPCRSDSDIAAPAVKYALLANAV